LRILVGTVEVGGAIHTLADGFRKLDHQVTTVIKERHAFFSDIQYDVDISGDALPWRQRSGKEYAGILRLTRRNLNRSVLLTRLLPLILKHDVFVFLWAGTSLTERNQEFSLLKKLVKKIISLFCGSDVRHSSGYSQFFAPLVAANAFEDWHELRDDFAAEPLARPLRDMRMAEQYADVVLSVPNNSMLAVRPYQHFFVPVNLSAYIGQFPARNIPVVVHAPSDKGIKGTGKILAALERLKREGVRFELRMLHGVTHQKVLSELADADVAIDQLNLPLHGMFGLEAMASRCALATCNREDYEPFPANRPIWHIDAQNIYSQLKVLLTDQSLRTSLAVQGRDYVERYHDHVKVGQRTLNGLTQSRPDHYPTFFARSYELPPGEVIPDYLKRMTGQIVQRSGIPADIDPNNMIRRGLMSATGLDTSQGIPRWTSELETIAV